MKPMPVQQRALIKRHALIDAAEELFATEGYEGTTAKRIASRADVAIGTFYQYFSNKEHILREIAQKMRDRVYDSIPEQLDLAGEQTQQDVSQLIRNVLEIIYQYHDNCPELHRVLDQRRIQDPELNRILLHWEDKVEARICDYLRNFSLTQPEVVAYNLFAMAEGLVHRHVFGPRHTDKNQTLDLAADMLASYLWAQN